MAHFEFVDWLAEWLFLTIPHFEWDEGNRNKNLLKHGVKTSEAEEIFFNRESLVVLGLQIQPETKELRFGVLGKTNQNKVLMVSFTLRENRVRPISVRPINYKEKKIYEEIYKVSKDI